VWELHAEGVPLRQIVTALGSGYNYSKAYQTVLRLKKIMFNEAVKERQENGTE
jgi:hypothetical protein